MTSNTETKKISCDGVFKGKDALSNENSKHPLIYLKVVKNESVKCPYCGKEFLYNKV